MFLRKSDYLTGLIATAVVLIATAAVHAEQATSATMLSPDRQQQIIEALRPWVVMLNDIGTHQLFGPAASIFFFLMILTYSKRSA